MKEALSNIAKHSDATEARIILREHPALCQLIIRDNGSKPAQGLNLAADGEWQPGNSGMGLKNIHERVAKLKGTVRIRNEKGFEIFVSIPKES
ncbi:MAG TPA: hypothetical protein PL099_05715 [Thermoclostridium caenicola]|nr:hypothetical protein [Thermoclostridium caenicola]